MNSELTTDIAGYIDHLRSSIDRASLSAHFASTILTSRVAVGFLITCKSWVKLWWLRARPIAARASTVSGMSVVYDKEGTDPCSGDAHYCECVYQ
jgi:hypothetical protein